LTPSHHQQALAAGAYDQTGSNSCIAVEPATVNFAGFRPGKSYKQTVRLCNVSQYPTRLQLIPPDSQLFHVEHKRAPGSIAPGLSEELVVTFKAEQHCYHYDCIRIRTQVCSHASYKIHHSEQNRKSCYTRYLVPVSKSATSWCTVARQDALCVLMWPLNSYSTCQGKALGELLSLCGARELIFTLLLVTV
jgi:hypothetical protein